MTTESWLASGQESTVLQQPNKTHLFEGSIGVITSFDMYVEGGKTAFISPVFHVAVVDNGDMIDVTAD